MKSPKHVSLAIEALEDRWCPTVTASLSHHELTLTGTAKNTLTVQETSAGAFEVEDGTSVVASVLTGVNNIKLSLTAPNNVNVNLAGYTLSGNLTANLGKGTSSLTVADGTITGELTVQGGTGADAVTLGAANTTLTIAHTAGIHLGGQTGGAITVLGGVTLSRDLVASAANVTLEPGSTVTRDAFIHGAVGGTVFDAAGKIDGGLHYRGSGKGDTLDLAGSARSLDLHLGAGNNQVTLASNAVIGHSAEIDFGNGNNMLSIADTIGPTGNTQRALTVSAGTGKNAITLLGTTVINGSAMITLGTRHSASANTLSLHDGATITGKLTATGGGNAASTFAGSVQPKHKNLAVTGFPITNSGANP